MWRRAHTRFVVESNVNGIPVREMVLYLARNIQEFIINARFPFFLHCTAELEVVDGLDCGNLRNPISMQVEGGQSG